MEPHVYGERIADVYDDWYGDATDVEATVATVARLADGGPVLELGIGTGRLAIPMTEAGLEVHGVDASPAMVERLRAKPGGESIPVTIGDFREVDAAGEFAVVLLAFNTVLNLASAEDQTACLRRAAARLRPGGCVVVEAFVPGDAAPAEALHVRHVDADEVRLSAYRIDADVVSGSMVSITETGIRLRPWQVRLTTPDELDAIAAAAGLRLDVRWSSWQNAPFDDTSPEQIAVYRAASN